MSRESKSRRGTRVRIEAGLKFPFITAAFSVVAYFVYGRSVDAALGIFLLCILGGLVVMLGFVPVVGVGITYRVWVELYTRIAEWAGITPTWVTKLVFAVDMLIAGVFSVIAAFLALGLLGVGRVGLYVLGVVIAAVVAVFYIAWSTWPVVV